MSKREYRPPRPGDKVGDINGWPDSRGLPTVRVVCEGWRAKGSEHKETVLATFQCYPFDPNKGECGAWFQDNDVAVGGGPRHDTTRLREEKAKRKATAEDRAAGWRWDSIEVTPKHHVGNMDDLSSTAHLKCDRCSSSDLHIKVEALQAALDKVLLAGDQLDDDMAELLRVGVRKLPLMALILMQTKPRGR